MTSACPPRAPTRKCAAKRRQPWQRAAAAAAAGGRRRPRDKRQRKRWIVTAWTGARVVENRGQSQQTNAE
jgi:hypothetical protein